MAARTSQALKRTPLYDRHVAAGAKLVPFAGWEMPVQYAGIREEHISVRTDCGVFDVSHMGQIETAGPQAGELLPRRAFAHCRGVLGGCAHERTNSFFTPGIGDGLRRGRVADRQRPSFRKFR